MSRGSSEASAITMHTASPVKASSPVWIAFPNPLSRRFGTQRTRRPALRRCGDDLRGCVGGVIVDHDDLEGDRLAVKPLRDGGDRRTDARLFVVRRDDDREGLHQARAEAPSDDQRSAFFA